MTESSRRANEVVGRRAVGGLAGWLALAFALRLAFGQMAEEALLGGQRVLPRRAEAEGFRFEARDIASGLARALGR
jgi:NAD dependent epimerase/dehydratase family enzyme